MTTKSDAIGIANSIPGWMSSKELGWLWDMVKTAPDDHAIVEIGSFKGHTTVLLAIAKQGRDGLGPIHTVDAFDPKLADSDVTTGVKDEFLGNVASLGLSDEIVLHTGKSDEIGKSWSGGPIGLLLVDGGHDYVQVSEDTLSWLPKMAVGGIVAYHDYGYWPGVTKIIGRIEHAFDVLKSPDSLWAGRVREDTLGEVQKLLEESLSPEVYWCRLSEKSMWGISEDAIVDVAIRAALNGYNRIRIPPNRTDVARNMLADAFIKMTASPQSWLVMLDADHQHPENIVYDLVNTGFGGIVAAVYRRRGGEEDMLAYRVVDGVLKLIPDNEIPKDSVFPVDAVGTGAIAIQRWVFREIETKENGRPRPWFRYPYKDGVLNFPTEDLDFCLAARAVGVQVYASTKIWTPHLALAYTDRKRKKYLRYAR